MRHNPPLRFCLGPIFKVFHRIATPICVQIANCTYSVFVAHILINFLEVVRRRTLVWVVDDGERLVNALDVKLVIHANGTFLRNAGEDEKPQIYQNHYDNLLLISTDLQDYIVFTRMDNICDYEVDLSKPVYLVHPNDKFWEVTMVGVSVTFRVGKVKGGMETGEEKVEKDYPSVASARVSVTQKIKDKLTKGYMGKDLKYKQPPKEERGIVVRHDDKKLNDFSGEYYENDAGASMKLQVNEKRIKITKKGAGLEQKVEYRHFDTNQDAVRECLKEESWLKGKGYKAMSHKFLYSFVDDQKVEKGSRPKVNNKGKNVLSITGMTDDAMSHRSRATSSAKSDRSFMSDDDNTFADTKSALGSPISGCIKVLLAQHYKDIDPVGWSMSEKLDGVRCFWTGSVMFSRNANRFFPPKFFTKNWPNSQLDGQLFIGRGRFSETLSAIKKHAPIDDEWKKVRYLVFDCPGLKKPFRQRIKAMEKVLGESDNQYIKCHAHRECTGFGDLFGELDKVNALGGEGLMLRDPESFYENRRSNSLLKVKTFHDDEATVLGYKAGTGRCEGMVGALRVRNTKGIEFEVGSGLTDQQRRKPPKIGSKITYKYQEFNKDSGKPRFPTYLRAYDHI